MIFCTCLSYSGLVVLIPRPCERSPAVAAVEEGSTRRGGGRVIRSGPPATPLGGWRQPHGGRHAPQWPPRSVATRRAPFADAAGAARPRSAPICCQAHCRGVSSLHAVWRPLLPPLWTRPIPCERGSSDGRPFPPLPSGCAHSPGIRGHLTRRGPVQCQSDRRPFWQDVCGCGGAGGEGPLCSPPIWSLGDAVGEELKWRRAGVGAMEPMKEGARVPGVRRWCAATATKTSVVVRWSLLLAELES